MSILEAKPEEKIVIELADGDAAVIFFADGRATANIPNGADEEEVPLNSLLATAVMVAAHDQDKVRELITWFIERGNAAMEKDQSEITGS